MFNFSAINTHQLLNKINENILIANEDYEIVFINDSAMKLLAQIGPYVGINDPAEFIGRNLGEFHGSRQQNILAGGNFPHSASITLFNKFSAEIMVDRLTNNEGIESGFILTWKDVTEFEETLEENRKQLHILDMPVIPLSVDSAVLVPVMGKLTEERLELLGEKILSHSAQQGNQYVIFDFTGVSDELDAPIAFRLQQVINALKLMGVQSIYVGIRPEMAKSIVLNGLLVDVPTFNTFVHGIRYVWKETGFQLVNISE
ncbi:STAS domain-containing protein [Mesobacillus selenatarsenatis]|uniref:RsbR, positive regulator of sigma-B n=1 Tax=Mesobacillus selenatarsenatis (strain DSM 18680 / JCM 14380 / FERM P-15431 / SF-1) TaxID=1321606 RepID=A0A0A8X189_MESS1|nr:STAS domain-containing protein [Mesobacillus selenatarsenatis]GAM12999.1 RsbR, positive regulator of sigma-B [Mesobacillus selenatarsenatis SF-1]